MNFSPSFFSNNQRIPTHTCTIEKCMNCPMKNSCPDYFSQLEKQVADKLEIKPIQKDNSDISLLLNKVNELTKQYNDLASIVVNLLSEDKVDIPKNENTKEIIIKKEQKTDEIKNEVIPNDNYIIDDNISMADTQDKNDNGYEISTSTENGLVVYSGKPEYIVDEKGSLKALSKNIFGQEVYKKIKDQKK